MIIGLTGGIGSGKSVVSRIFSMLGIPVFDSDAEAKKLYASSPELLQRIKKEISKEVIDQKGNLDKQKLAAAIFSDPEMLRKLNALVHPFVINNFKNWCQAQTGSPYLIKEAAILFESGTDKGCDKIITVSAPVELRIQRIIQRDKKKKEEIERIIAQQWKEEDKIERADFVILNDESEAVIPQVLEIHQQLSAKD